MKKAAQLVIVTAFIIALGLLLTVVADKLGAQTPINPTQGPPPDAYTSLLFYDGSNNLQYVCKAKAQQPSFAWTVADTTLTSIVVLTNTGTVTTSTAHGLAVGNLVTVSGATVDTDLNGTYFIQTVGSTTTFTITTSAVSNATYTDATLSLATTAPRSTVAIWDMFKFTYTNTTYLAVIQKAKGAAGLNSICGNKAVTTGSTKITWQ